MSVVNTSTDARLRWRRAFANVTQSEFSLFEYWPNWLFYTPVVLHWIWQSLKHRGITLPVLANPLIETGGMCGESKTAILDQIGAEERSIIARYASFVTAPAEGDNLACAEAAIQQACLTYPLVAKPDIGCNGTGVKIIDGPKALAGYLAVYPGNTRIILQELIDDEWEAGVFYVRRPGETCGRITSLTLKSSPYVIGDGVSTLRQLIHNDQRARQLEHLYLPRLASRLAAVPAAGENVRLVFVGNHCKGSIFRNGNADVTPEMTVRFDKLAKSMPEFYFGRFDVRYSSRAALRKGTGFRLIEVNGVGSEATHIWDKNTRLVDAYRALFMHYRLAFEIGTANRARGFSALNLIQLAKFWHLQKRLMALYPLND